MEAVAILTLRAARAATKRAFLNLASVLNPPSEAMGTQFSRRVFSKTGDSANQVGMEGLPEERAELS